MDGSWELVEPGPVVPPSAGDLLRLARRLADLSQRELAELADVPHSAVARIESGATVAPRLGTIQKLLGAAGFELVLTSRADRGAEHTGPADVPAEVTDRAGRRFPAHLDVRPVDEFGSWWGDWGMLSTRARSIWHLAPRQRPEHTFDRRGWQRNARRKAQREAQRDTSREAGGYARRDPGQDP